LIEEKKEDLNYYDLSLSFQKLKKITPDSCLISSTQTTKNKQQNRDFQNEKKEIRMNEK